MDELGKEILRKTALFLIALAILLFLPAWSLTYWQGWLYWLAFAVLTTGGSLYFLKYDPALVHRRMSVGATAETEPVQKVAMAITSVALIALFIVAPLDHRFGWSHVTDAACVSGLILTIAGYSIALATLMGNTFAAATITVEQGQTVVSSGLNAWVRHPMYSGAILMFFATPVALGSYWGLTLALVISAAIVVRLLDEERVLTARLAGYDAYCREVRYRLLPGVW
jgi:protein-S-isoprenylcysteine O-methyltransferase Ste14